MSLAFKVGQQVTQVVTPITGVVKEAKIVDGDQVAYVVVYTDTNGVEHERTFNENEIQ